MFEVFQERPIRNLRSNENSAIVSCIAKITEQFTVSSGHRWGGDSSCTSSSCRSKTTKVCVRSSKKVRGRRGRG